MIVPFSHVMALSGILFLLGMLASLASRNLIMMLLGIEIMLNASAVAFVGAALRWHTLESHAMVIFIITVAAAEVSVGLAMIIASHRRTGSLDPESLQ
ncbi:MAG: NADH-quinone oxidoreductase subunit NuoK [Desulfobacterales bacterium]